MRDQDEVSRSGRLSKIGGDVMPDDKPKVFLSHASEDKERFVLEFARRLRENGVDVWLDRWEMLPGDSLIDKIFEEGLSNAGAVVVVLSRNSITKPWVREELNTALVKRISTGSKLIPIVLDDCEVPEALASTVWERIEDPVAYDESFARVLNAVFGSVQRPSLGSPPQYIRSALNEIPGLSPTDNLVLKRACENIIESNNVFVTPSAVSLGGDESLIPESELRDSLEVLDQYGHIELVRTMGEELDPFRVTMFGLDTYLEAYRPDYAEILNGVAFAILNKRLYGNAELQGELGAPQRLIDHAMDRLESDGYIKQAKSMGGWQQVLTVSPTMRRALEK